MKRYLIAACLLMLVASSASAATKGSKELLFGFSGLTNLGANTYQGGIGMRHWTSDNMAVRPSVNLGFSSDKTDGQGGNTDAKLTNTSLGVNVAIEKHMGGSETVSPYMGVGVGASMFSNKNEPSVAATPTTGTLLKTTDSGMDYGVFGLLGFQWTFAKGLSLDGEYQLGLGGNSAKTEDVRQGLANTTAKNSGFSLGLSTATLALSVAL